VEHGALANPNTEGDERPSPQCERAVRLLMSAVTLVGKRVAAPPVAAHI